MIASRRITSARDAAAGAALAVTVLSLTACGSGGHAGTPQAPTAASHTATTTSAAAAPTSSPPGQGDQLALQLLNHVIQCEYSAVTTHFDDQMRQKLTAQQLGSAWRAYQQTLGSYQSHGDPEDVRRGELTVVNIPLQMAQEPGQFRVTFHSDGTVAGLYFLRAGI